MCGLAGFIYPDGNCDETQSRVEVMLGTLRHRGPDDHGIWVDDQLGVAIGHCRLSILDLSHNGHQPMKSRSGNFVIGFNGEIYNHLELREKLERNNQAPSAGWLGHSDTETFLACLESWGIKKTLQSSVGMFAFALWDKTQNSLTIARDRIGEKPIYYGWQKGTFLFGSELKSLRVHPAFEGRIDWDAAGEFFRHNYIPAPSSIYCEIFKLVPGTFFQLTQNDIKHRTLPPLVPYWSLDIVAQDGLLNPFSGTLNDAVDELEKLVRQSVLLQSVADVPVGAFLSGGVDSSTVVALMQAATTSRVTTFTIGMPDHTMDESSYAAEVARYLHTNHIEYVVSSDEAIDIITKLPDIWDEPFADSSQIPTYLVSQLAKKEVTVALSGDGGDELFLGYPQYAFYDKIWNFRFLEKMPWDIAFKILKPLEKYRKFEILLRRSKSIVNAWRQPNVPALNKYWMDKYRQDRMPILGVGKPATLEFPVLPDAATTAGLWDVGTYLPDDILVKVDIAAMANSLETRAPLLDHRIVEFAYCLPPEFKFSGGVGKKVLREILYRYVPEGMVNRPKMSFSIPLGEWLKNELRAWVEHMLNQLPEDHTYLDKSVIHQLWTEHLTGRRVHTDQLWGILCFLEFMNH